MTRRWDDDEVGSGVGSAIALAPGANELLEAFARPDWVTEAPDVHLLPHIDAWCRQDRRLTVVDSHIDAAQAFVVDLQWDEPTESVGAVRAAVFSLIGSFAESATYVRQRRAARGAGNSAAGLQFEVGTGEVGPDASFDSHGHVVLINVAGGF